MVDINNYDFKPNINPMKTRELYSIVLKIIGLISLWHSVTMIFAVVLSGFGVFSMLFSSGSQMIGGFLIASAFAIILQTVLPLIIAFYCLFRTDTLLKALRLDDDTTLELLTDRKVIYHILVLSFGVFLLANGANGFLSVDIKADTKTEMLQAVNNIGNSPNVVSVIESKNYNINFFALIELLIGLYLLVKSRSISGKIMGRFDSSNVA